MSSSGDKRNKASTFVPGTVVRDPYARFVFGLAPHPSQLKRLQRVGAGALIASAVYDAYKDHKAKGKV